MNESAKGRVTDAEWFSRLELVKNPEPGRIRVRLAFQPDFLKGIFFVFLCGIICGTLQYLNAVHVFGSFHIISLFDSVYFMLLLPGAFYITNHFNFRKFILLLFSVVLFETYYIIVYGNPKLVTMLFFIATWQIFYWTWTEPEIMEKLGVRKRKLVQDITVAIVPSILISVYVIVGLNSYGLPFELHTWKFISKIASTFPMSLVISMFVFTVWNKLQAKGPGLLWVPPDISTSQKMRVLVLSFA